MSAFSAHTLEAISKGQACETAIHRISPRILGLLIWVGDVRNQGYSWNPCGDTLSMYASNADGGGYHDSMMSGDALGFSDNRCGILPVSTMSRGADLTSSCPCKPCENTAGSWAGFAVTGPEGYVYTEHEPFLPVSPHADDHAIAGKQLAQ